MRISSIVATFAALLAALVVCPAEAAVFDATALAKYDLSYVKCEAQLPQMKGRRDEAYLSLYRIKADEKSLARLTRIRGSAEYAAEKKRAAGLAAKATPVGPSASNSLARECQALLGETQRAKSK
jgi:hypothetical protein